MSQHRSSNAPHAFSPGSAGPCAGSACAPSPRRDPESPEVRELLETLDDAMFAAIAGNDGALQRARDLWTHVVATLGWELIDESREQYLRYAADVTRRSEVSEIRNPAAAVAAIEVIELLTRDA
jgi:hypothetical protein